MLLCRLAENAYWLGRYLERAEDLSRALLAYEQIRLDIPGQRAPGWQRLAALAGGSHEDCQNGRSSSEGPEIDSAAFVSRVILDRGNPSSLLGALHAARENLRRSRGLFPSECWHTLNPLYLSLAALEATVPPAELSAVLEQAVASSRELGGHVGAGMLRDEGYAFLRMGMHLERADMMLRVATIVAETLIPSESGIPFENVRWTGLLKSVGAYGTYRHRYHSTTDFKSALQLLLFEPTFPRSLAHGLGETARFLDNLPGNSDALAALSSCRPTEAIETRAALEGFAVDRLERLAHASAVLEKRYFSLALPPSVAEAADPCPHPRHIASAPDELGKSQESIAMRP